MKSIKGLHIYSKAVPTPYEFEEQIKRIIKEYEDDLEGKHVELDLYICTVLESLGYSDGVRLFRSTEKWYA